MGGSRAAGAQVCVGNRWATQIVRHLWPAPPIRRARRMPRRAHAGNIGTGRPRRGVMDWALDGGRPTDQASEPHDHQAVCTSGIGESASRLDSIGRLDLGRSGPTTSPGRPQLAGQRGPPRAFGRPDQPVRQPAGLDPRRRQRDQPGRRRSGRGRHHSGHRRDERASGLRPGGPLRGGRGRAAGPSGSARHSDQGRQAAGCPDPRRRARRRGGPGRGRHRPCGRALARRQPPVHR